MYEFDKTDFNDFAVLRKPVGESACPRVRVSTCPRVRVSNHGNFISGPTAATAGPAAATAGPTATVVFAAAAAAAAARNPAVGPHMLIE